MRKTIISTGLALLVASCVGHTPTAKPPSVASAAQSQPLSAEALRAHIDVLASDAFEGRKPGTEGEKKTLEYLVSQFQAAGLSPGWQGQWLQPVKLVGITATNQPALRITNAAGADVANLAYGSDQIVWTKREAPRVLLQDRELVFVGYGVAAPERGWNDYAGQSMRGKVAVILINDPDYGQETGPFDGPAMTYYGRWTYKFEEAARQGAAGALIIHDTGPAAYPWSVVQSSWTGPQYSAKSADRGQSRVGLEGWVQLEAAKALFKQAGQNFDALAAAARKPGFRPLPLGLRLSTDLESTLVDATSYNVVAALPGRTRPQEVVLYGAHWDHLGRCPPVDGDDICNGAVDNASGVAGLLELARAHAAAGPAARSLAFLAFTGEEQGLLGSAQYAATPAFPIEHTVAMINMDGLPVHGRTRDLTVIGFGKSDLDVLLAEAAAAQGRVLEADPHPERGGFYRSDHFNLAKAGVPALFARGGVDLLDGGKTRGNALDAAYVAQRYHKPSDQPSSDWDLSGASEDVQAFYAVGRRLAEGEMWPAWAAGAEFHRPTPPEASGK